MSHTKMTLEICAEASEEDIELCLKAKKLVQALNAFQADIRIQLKYHDADLSETQKAVIEAVRARLNYILDDYGLQDFLREYGYDGTGPGTQLSIINP